MPGPPSDLISLPSKVAEMPPPTVTVLFAPPPQITPPNTINQLLAYQPPMPSAPSGVSVAMLAAKVSRPPHYSSSSTRSCALIHAWSLRRIPNVLMVEFRALIDSMDSDKFDQHMALPCDASPMMSEACITSYLDIQVLGAVWQIVLLMLPDERDDDLQMVKQGAFEVIFLHSTDVNVADIVTVRCRKESQIKHSLFCAELPANLWSWSNLNQLVSPTRCFP